MLLVHADPPRVCAVQWVRHYQDGTAFYIEGMHSPSPPGAASGCHVWQYTRVALGVVVPPPSDDVAGWGSCGVASPSRSPCGAGAKQPEYLVSADDARCQITVECLPVDSRGRKVGPHSPDTQRGPPARSGSGLWCR
jgi:hypothetical protein